MSENARKVPLSVMNANDTLFMEPVWFLADLQDGRQYLIGRQSSGDSPWDWEVVQYNAATRRLTGEVGTFEQLSADEDGEIEGLGFGLVYLLPEGGYRQ